MYLLRREKEEILEALEEKYRSVLKVLYERDWLPDEYAELITRIIAIKAAMKKVQTSMK